MNRQRSDNLKHRLQKICFFIPFTWHFLAFCLLAGAGWRWLTNKELVPDTAYTDIFTILLKVALTFVCSIIILAFISVTISWLFVYLRNRKKQVRLNINTGDDKKIVTDMQQVNIAIHPLLKPLLGFTRIRLRYDSDRYSNKFSLVEKRNTGIFSTTLAGTYYWRLPEIKEYHIADAIIYFEDLFQFFSLAVKVPAHNRFITQPNDKKIAAITAFPRKTEETTTRIEEIKRVEGEHINYKHFEANDDVRRIVWKIYAKNKELVVRIPEIMDPYASHIYLYASFYSSFNTDGNNVVEKPFLNHYKSVVWTIYRQLAEQGFEVRYVPDLKKNEQHFSNDQHEVRYSITTASWQQQKDLSSYIKPHEAAVLIVSSLSDSTQVAEIAESYGNDIIIILVKLSDSLSQQSIANWIEWIFVRHEKDEREKFRTAWSLSRLRPRIRDNEALLEKILSRLEKPVII